MKKFFGFLVVGSSPATSSTAPPRGGPRGTSTSPYFADLDAILPGQQEQDVVRPFPIRRLTSSGDADDAGPPLVTRGGGGEDLLGTNGLPYYGGGPPPPPQDLPGGSPDPQDPGDPPGRSSSKISFVQSSLSTTGMDDICALPDLRLVGRSPHTLKRVCTSSDTSEDVRACCALCDHPEAQFNSFLIDDWHRQCSKMDMLHRKYGTTYPEKMVVKKWTCPDDHHCTCPDLITKDLPEGCWAEGGKQSCEVGGIRRRRGHCWRGGVAAKEGGSCCEVDYVVVQGRWGDSWWIAMRGKTTRARARIVNKQYLLRGEFRGVFNTSVGGGTTGNESMFETDRKLISVPTLWKMRGTFGCLVKGTLYWGSGAIML